MRRAFEHQQYYKCRDDSLGSNDRWGIVAQKNLFGAEAILLPTRKDDEGKKLVLQACSGRFQMQKFPNPVKYFFPNTIDISDILDRSEEEQFKEIETFYNMTNREVFERFGVNVWADNQMMLLANCVVLDSLLKGKYEELDDVYCLCPYGDGNYTITVKLQDGTKIEASVTNQDNLLKGIILERNGKKAQVTFNAISTNQTKEFILANINDLEVEDVEYTGDLEVISELQQAMQEQFKSQRQQVQIQDSTVDPKKESLYERYSEMANDILGKAEVSSYGEDYELEGLKISIAYDGLSVFIRSDSLGICFFMNDEMCTFYDFDYLVQMDYRSEEEQKKLADEFIQDEHLSIEERLRLLEEAEPENKEIIERMKSFAKKLEELTRLERANGEITQSNNAILIDRLLASGVTDSDIKNLQQTLIGIKEPKKTIQLDENGSHDEEGK